MKKINNVVIENQSPEFAVELKKFWDGVEIKETIAHWFGYSKYDFSRIGGFYGIIDGVFGAYEKEEIPEGVRIFSNIPTLAELGLELTETEMLEILSICEKILMPQQMSEVANWCIVNALRLPPTTLALVVEKLSQHVPKTNKAFPKLDIKYQEIKTDTAYGKFHSWTAELVGVEGMVAESGTKEGAIKELMKSIEAKLIFDMESR